MQRIQWDKYEAVLLIETFWKIENKEVGRKLALQQLSNTLREYGKNRGFYIDEYYRNFNGISLMLASIAAEFLTPDNTRHSSELFAETVELYNNDRQAFDSLLQEAHKIVTVKIVERPVLKHKIGVFNSWEIVDENTAVKSCDKSVFQYNGSGVPKEISWFFDAEYLPAGAEFKITLLCDNCEFYCKVSKDNTTSQRVRLSWDANFEKKLALYKDGTRVKIKFVKSNEKRYNVFFEYTVHEQAPKKTPVKNLETYMALFRDYLQICGIKKIEDITTTIYVAFKSKYRLTSEEIKAVRDNVSSDILTVVVEPAETNDVYGSMEQRGEKNGDTTVEEEKIAVSTMASKNPVHEQVKRVDVNAFILAEHLAVHQEPDVEEATSKVQIVVTQESIGDTLTVGHEPIVDVPVVEKKADKTSIPFTEEFDLSKMPFNQIHIRMLNLSVRAYNVLSKNGIYFLRDLYSVDVLAFRNCGAKTVQEIENLKTRFAFRKDETDELQIPFLKIARKNMMEYIREKLRLEFEEYEDWDDGQIYRNYVDESIDLLGPEICQLALERPTVCYGFFESLNNIVGEAGENLHRRTKLCALIRKMPDAVRKAPINSLIKFYCKFSNKFDMVESYKSICYAFNTFEDLLRCKDVSLELFEILYPIITTFNVDVADLISKFLQATLSAKKGNAEVCIKRAKGETLEAIATEMGVTRERIRQIERHNISEANKIYDKYHIVELISAIRGDDRVLLKSEIAEYVKNEDIDTLVYILGQVQSENFTYDRHLKLFDLGETTSYREISQVLFELPEYIFKVDWQNEITTFAKNHSLELEYVKQAASSIFVDYGTYYARRKVSLISMYEYVVREYYPTGIKLYTNETNHFRELVKKVFGENADVPSKNRAIDAAIPRISVLCDRGTYIHASHIRLDNDLIKEIDQYLERMTRTAISYAELFNIFQDKLFLRTSVTNRYYLQGVLKLCLGEKYFSIKDLISKNRDVTVDDEIDAFVRERQQVNRKEIMQAFDGLRESAICQIISRCKNVIGINNAEYIHSSTLVLYDKDYDIRNIIAENVQMSPISTRKLLEILYVKAPDFLDRNHINSHTKLYGILQFMFGNEFSFSSPFIAIKGNKNITNTSVALTLLSDYSEISIEELIDICDEHRIKYGSINSLVASINNAFLRTDSNTLISVDMMYIDESDVEKINAFINIKLQETGYLSLKTFDDWIWLPSLDVTWNNFLLRSILQKYNDEVVLIDYPCSDNYIMSTIAVSEQIGSEDYLSLIKYAIKRENSQATFVSAQEVIDWLKENGLIGTELPTVIVNNWEELLPNIKLMYKDVR